MPCRDCTIGQAEDETFSLGAQRTSAVRYAQCESAISPARFILTHERISEAGCEKGVKTWDKWDLYRNENEECIALSRL
jgi:hypothetical protein